jgi:hypothetical protein
MPLHCTVPPLKRMVHIGCAQSFHLFTSPLIHKPMLHLMPHLAQPSGALQQMRTQYTARRKLALLRMAKCLWDEEGISLRKSSERVQVSAGLLVKWEEHFSLGNDPIKALLKGWL